MKTGVLAESFRLPFRDALRAAPTDELTVCINTGSAPCVIVPADGSDEFVYMVLPVRLAK